MGEKTKITLDIGRCEEVLTDWDADSVDAVVTDPPYGLGEDPPIRELLSNWIDEGDHDMGSGFMGNSWDQVPGPRVFQEIIRVLKPGGKGMFFAGTRTVDLMMLSLRLAGFEIEGVFRWTYGNGFPKSHNVHKHIMKKVRARYDVVKNGEVVEENRCSCEFEGSGHFDPEAEPDEEREHERRTICDDWDDRDLVTRVCSWCRLPDPGFLEWIEGTGTALKPTFEPIVMVRKPDPFEKPDPERILSGLGFDEDDISEITDDTRG